jgi:hypothetical protein
VQIAQYRDFAKKRWTYTVLRKVRVVVLGDVGNQSGGLSRHVGWLPAKFVASTLMERTRSPHSAKPIEAVSVMVSSSLLLR